MNVHRVESTTTPGKTRSQASTVSKTLGEVVYSEVKELAECAPFEGPGSSAWDPNCLFNLQAKEKYVQKEDFYELGGTFLPLSVWDRKGYDAEAIQSKNGPWNAEPLVPGAGCPRWQHSKPCCQMLRERAFSSNTARPPSISARQTAPIQPG